MNENFAFCRQGGQQGHHPVLIAERQVAHIAPGIAPDAGGLQLVILPDGAIDQQTVRFLQPRQKGFIRLTQPRA